QTCALPTRRKLIRSGRAARNSRTGIEISPNVMKPRHTVLAILGPIKWDFAGRKPFQDIGSGRSGFVGRQRLGPTDRRNRENPVCVPTAVILSFPRGLD